MRPFTTRGSAPEDVEDRRQQEAEQQRGHERKVEREVALPIDDVAGQPAQARDPGPQGKKQADDEEHAAEDEERAADLRHDPYYRRRSGITEARRRRSMRASLSGKEIFVMVIPQPVGRV